MSTLTPLTSNASTNTIEVQGAYTVSAVGTYDGATVTMQASWDGETTWIDLTDSNDVVFAPTADAAKNIDIAKGSFRATMSSAGTSNVSVSLVTFRDLR